MKKFLNAQKRRGRKANWIGLILRTKYRLYDDGSKRSRKNNTNPRSFEKRTIVGAKGGI
jgi:hypothetical protein